jgi:hypothetical protein
MEEEDTARVEKRKGKAKAIASEKELVCKKSIMRDTWRDINE